MSASLKPLVINSGVSNASIILVRLRLCRRRRILSSFLCLLCLLCLCILFEAEAQALHPSIHPSIHPIHYNPSSIHPHRSTTVLLLLLLKMSSTTTGSITTSSYLSVWDQIYSTFDASLRSVGTACTLAAVGVYLHRQGYVVGDGKRTLALISQQVTIPLLFFTKILYCNQDWSEEPCPDITESLKDVWVLLIWPVYVVGMGLAVGYAAAKLSRTPPHQLRAVLVACGFSNSTGIPITLLTVVHSQFPETTDLGRIDPTLFLSVYLLLYPVLQWGVGGWLLVMAPEEKAEAEEEANEPKETEEEAQQEAAAAAAASNNNDAATTLLTLEDHPATSSISARNVLNMTTSDSYNWLHRGMGETDASMYMSVQDNLFQLGRAAPDGNNNNNNNNNNNKGVQQSSGQGMELPSVESFQSIGMNLEDQYPSTGTDANEQTALLAPVSSSYLANSIRKKAQSSSLTTNTEGSSSSSLKGGGDDDPNDIIPSSYSSSSSPFESQLWDTVQVVLQRCLQPPVVGALMGMLVASQPRFRGVLVDLVDRGGHAPLQWMFDGLYSIGQSAVPINMMILGCNLSASFHNNNNKNKKEKAQEDGHDDDDDDDEKTRKAALFSRSTMIAIVIGKMIVMPIIGFLSAYLLKTWWWESHIPDDIGGSFYLVIMIVFLTPTANNVMVMVELASSGGGGGGGGGGGMNNVGIKEGMAQIIAWQYAVAPIILSLTMTVAVCIAVLWS